MGDVDVKYNGKKVAGAFLMGATAQLAMVSEFAMQEGRLWNDAEDARHAHVCMIGHDTAEKLFGDEDPIGKDVNVAPRPLHRDRGGGQAQAAIRVRQKSRRQRRLLSAGRVSQPVPGIKDMYIVVRYDDQKNKALVEEEVRELLRIRRKVKVQNDDNFEIMGPDTLTKLWGQLTGGLVLFMIAVSSVGLMVGGVGVMNIMLVSVTERTREIGVRKAIGATKRAILPQFTTEAVTLCAVGGVFGVLAGAVITWIIYFLPIGLPASLSTLWVITGSAYPA